MNRFEQLRRSEWLAIRAQVALGCIFVAAALPKLQDPPGFAKNIWQYAMLPDWIINLKAMALPGIELIAGLAKVASAPYPDASQFDRKSPYFDPKARREEPRWMLVDVKLDRKTRLMPLDEMRAHRELAAMITLKRGNRLSITPVTESQWKFIVKSLDA